MIDLPYSIPQAVRDRIAAMTPEQLHAEVSASIEQQRMADYAALRHSRGGESQGLPVVYQGVTWADVPGSCPAHDHVLRCAERFAEVFGANDYRLSGLSMLFHGLPGTGKTKLACAVANAITPRGFSVTYTKAVTIFARIKDSFGGRSGESESSIMASLNRPDLLIIDEVGRGYLSDSERTWLFQVIDQRYDSAKPMLLVSNQTAAELERTLTPAGAERMYERCRGKWLEFTWPSFRGRMGKVGGAR